MTAIEYAQSKNWFPQFCKNFDEAFARKQEENGNIVDFESYVREVPPKRFINKAFLWERSPEGFEFWNDIDDEFLTECFN